MSAPRPSVPIHRLPAGTRFRFGLPLQPAAIHGMVEGPGVEGGVLVRLNPRKDHGKIVSGELTEWSRLQLVEVEG